MTGPAPSPRELLRLTQLSCQQFLRDNAHAFRAVAQRAAEQFGVADLDAIVGAIEARIWHDYPQIIRARNPLAVALRAAQSAAVEEAIQQLPDDQRLKLRARNRAKRRNEAS